LIGYGWSGLQWKGSGQGISVLQQRRAFCAASSNSKMKLPGSKINHSANKKPEISSNLPVGGTTFS